MKAKQEIHKSDWSLLILLLKAIIMLVHERTQNPKDTIPTPPKPATPPAQKAEKQVHKELGGVLHELQNGFRHPAPTKMEITVLPLSSPAAGRGPSLPLSE